MLSEVLITGGLALDIVGAIFIFKFGLPPRVSRGGTRSLLLEGHDPKEAAKAELYDRLGKVGVGLLILGFFLQIVGVCARFIPVF